MSKPIKWAGEPTPDDVAKAAEYLALVGVTGVALDVPAKLVRVQAKNLLRASRLEGLPANNAGVAKWTGRIKNRDTIPPCLLVCGDLYTDRPLIIAEGYHRVSACYLLDEQTEVAAFWLAAN